MALESGLKAGSLSKDVSGYGIEISVELLAAHSLCAIAQIYDRQGTVLHPSFHNLLAFFSLDGGETARIAR